MATITTITTIPPKTKIIRSLEGTMNILLSPRDNTFKLLPILMEYGLAHKL